MPNNAGLYNSVINGGIGGSHERWITDSNDSGYSEIRNAITALADAVDVLIDPDNELSDADARLMQAIVQGVFADRYPQSTEILDYNEIAQSIVALWTVMQEQLLEENIASFQVVPEILEEVEDFDNARAGTVDTSGIGWRNWDIDRISTASYSAPTTGFTSRAGIQMINDAAFSTNTTHLKLERARGGSNLCTNAKFIELLEGIISPHLLASNVKWNFGFGDTMFCETESGLTDCIYFSYNPATRGPNFHIFRRLGGSTSTFNLGVPAIPDPSVPTWFLFRIQREGTQYRCSIFRDILDNLVGSVLVNNIDGTSVNIGTCINQTTAGTSLLAVDWIHKRSQLITRLGRSEP